MIQTSYKAKLAKGTTYPINATDLSLAIGEDVSERLSLNFFLSPYRFQSYLEELKNPYARLLLVECVYLNRDIRAATPRDPSKSGYIGEKETLYVYPVLFKSREQIYLELITVGLPKLKEWLDLARPDTWRTGKHYFEIWWNQGRKTVEFESAWRHPVSG